MKMKRRFGIRDYNCDYAHYAPIKVNPMGEGGAAGKIWGFDSKHVPLCRGFDRQFCHLDNNPLFSFYFFMLFDQKLPSLSVHLTIV